MKQTMMVAVAMCVLSINTETKQIASFAYEGQCMQALIASERTEFALIDCSDHPRQRFDYNATDKTFSLEEDPSRCLAVDSVTQEAGPWVKRPLKLEACDTTADALKQWTIVAE